MTRLLTAAVAVPLLLLVILKAPAWVFFAVVLSALLIAFWELSSLMRATGWLPLAAGYPSVVLLAGSYYFERLTFLDASLTALLIIGTAVIFSLLPDAGSLAGAMGTVFATFYVGALGGSLLALRVVGPDPAGRRWVIFLLAVVMIGDAGAYYAGSALGRRRLAPKLSPKKTVEGLAGGALSSIATACALQMLWFPAVSLASAAGLGLMLALLGVVGDLFESFLKRSAGVKDASTLIPGHGGVLDRIDSIVFAAPGLLLWLRWMTAL